MPRGSAFQVSYRTRYMYETDFEIVRLAKTERVCTLRHVAPNLTTIDVSSSPVLGAYATQVTVGIYSRGAARRSWSSPYGEYLPPINIRDAGGRGMGLLGFSVLPLKDGTWSRYTALSTPAAKALAGDGGTLRCVLHDPHRRVVDYLPRNEKVSELVIERSLAPGKFPETVRISPDGFLALRAVDASGLALPWVVASVKATDGNGDAVEITGSDEGYLVENASLGAGREYVVRLWSNSRQPGPPDRELRFVAQPGVTDLGAVVLPGYGIADQLHSGKD